MNNYTYLLECADGTLYCGWTTDPDRRLKAHNDGTGGKYTRSRRPVRLVWLEAFPTRREAMRREAEIKTWSRERKLQLIQTQNRPQEGRMNFMLKEMGFYRGVDLGGWFSQCDYSRERLDHFIEEKDFERIASWGLDHVRLPVDYNILESEDGTVYLDEGFGRINRATGWARKNGLNLVIDLHKTAGFSFDSGEREAGFFENEALQERFCRLWEQIASRCAGDPNHVAFELLNEVTDPAFMNTWNAVAGECIRRIRKIAPDHLILVGGYHNNAPEAVPALDPPADARVIYNFHCYSPLSFTHQGAHWVEGMDPAFRQTFAEADMPVDYFDQLFAPAIEAAKKYGTDLYCGEYGVIENATPEDTVLWFRRIHDAFERYGIARCAWSYREMNFGLADARLDGVRDELVKWL